MNLSLLELQGFFMLNRMQAEFSLPSFAKINWSLRVPSKREDGYHEICTVFQTISLHDTISFRGSSGLSLTCSDEHLPSDPSNLCLRAALALKELLGTDKGAAIHLEKHIPSPGGLGGGSSNAAVTLFGLMQLWGIEVDPDELFELAAGLGSDVPFFLIGGTALGLGRGEMIEPLPELDEKYILIVTPNVSVPTKDAFEGLQAPNLTISETNRILRVCRSDAFSLDLRRSVLINDFETSVFSAEPEIKRVKETLLKLGAVNAALSGSGASVFAIFDKQETRQAAKKALDHESTWQKFVVATIARAEYRHALHLSG